MKKVTLVFLLCATLAKSVTTKKKSTDKVETTSPGPAIVAIEIVERNDSSTELRNTTKRTIESALGYGFQGNYYSTNHGKKFMVYPYSQHDIPPPVNKADSSKYLNIQKSVSYNLGTKTEPVPVKHYYAPVPEATQSSTYNVQPTANYYPSTLFSTVGQTGQLSHLSKNFPTNVQGTTSIPVIVLRVYTNQLSDNSIYPNLPQSHPYAMNLNSVNLQSLLSNYLQQHLYQTQQQPQVQMYQNLGYQTQNTPNDYQSYLSQNTYQNQGGYQYQQDSGDALPTHENYPDNAHTRVVYHGPKGHIQDVGYSSNSASYAIPSSNQPIYTDSNGQSYIYVSSNQLQNQGYYQEDYQQGYPQQEYQQNYQEQDKNKQYIPAQQQYEPSYQTNYQSQEKSKQYEPAQQIGQTVSYQELDKSRQYLPLQQIEQTYQTTGYQNEDKNQQYLQIDQTPEKVFNYHASAANLKDRAKKSSGAPVTFDIPSIKETDRKPDRKSKRN